MNCPQCATENPEGARFCMACAAPLGLVCAECGTELPIGAKFCFSCAAPVGPLPEHAQPPERDASAAKLQRLVPKEYAERLLATRGQVGRERRTVTILFSDVKGSTAMAEDLDPEEVMEIMDVAFDVLIEPVYRYEGTLARLMGDAVLAFFGAPIAHEDDPERAIRAALDIISGAQEYAQRLERERGLEGFNARVGINTGLVVVGEVGSDLRVEYTAMGDAINLAARMEQNAPPGGILISHDTYRHVRGMFDVEPLEPLYIKGRTEPVQAYLVEGAKARAFRKPMRGVEGIETHMVGREAELKHLQDAFYSAMEDGELQQVTISGEAGVGKSRLLHEFDIWAEVLPVQFYYFRGRANPEMRYQPYGLIRDLIAFRFQIQESDPGRMVREKLEAGVRLALGDERNSQAAAHLIGHLLGFEIGESPHLATVRDDAQAMRDRALEYLAGYFQGAAAQLLVLILLEDLHWADDSSLDALNQLSQALTGESLMVVAAARPELYERRPHWGEGQPFHTRLDLGRLSKWDSRRLVAEILQKVAEVPQTLRDLIVGGAEGNPFFIEELVKMLVEDSVIVKGEEAWHLAPDRLAGVHVPPTLTGVLQARVDRLPVEERTVLQQASVVGRLFWDRAVARINASAGEGIEEAEIRNNLSALRSREMVFQRETSAFADAQEYLFKHALLREVAYESVLKRVRRVYHGLVADWLLEQAGERLEEYTGLIADHLALAGRTEEAVDYLLQAGDRARGLYAHQEAIRAYEQALALLKAQSDDERTARTLMKLGLTHHNAFAYRQSRAAYDEGFALWQKAAQVKPAKPPPPAPHALRQGVSRRDYQTLDPALEANEASSQLFSGLVAPTPEMESIPDVAWRWEVLDGGRTYVFHLREDVRWSDGVPVTAHDFEYAWKRALDLASGSPFASLLYDIKGARACHQGKVGPEAVGVRALDAVTLAIELEAPTGYFLHLLTHSVASPVPRHALEAHGEDWTAVDRIVTNGPWRVESWQRGERLILARNETYHGHFGGNLKRVELVFLGDLWGTPDWHLQTAGLYECGTLDVVRFARADWLRQKHAEEHVSFPALWLGYVGFDPSQPPFNDLRVRRAFALAIDRDRFVQEVWEGLFTPTSGGLIPPGMPGHSPDIGLPCDPAQARELLAESGYPEGHGFPTVKGVGGHPREIENLQAQWRENLGLEVDWQVLDLATAYETLGRELPPLFWAAWMAAYPDPDDLLRTLFLEPYCNWHNDTYDRLVEEARRLTDQELRMKLYRQADRILVEEVPLTPVMYLRQHLLVKPWVQKYVMSLMGEVFWKDVVIGPH